MIHASDWQIKFKEFKDSTMMTRSLIYVSHRLENQFLVNLHVDNRGKNTLFSKDTELYNLRKAIDELKDKIKIIEESNEWIQTSAFKNEYEDVDNGLPWSVLEIMTEHDLVTIEEDMNLLRIVEEGQGDVMKYMKDWVVNWDEEKSLNWTEIVLKKKSLGYSPGFGASLRSEKGTVEFGDLANVCDIKSLPRGQNLVIADGVLNHTEYKESKSLYLIFVQVITALYTQKKDGTFMMKIFDTETKTMVDLMYLLGSHYRNVSITKCDAIKSCNSEKYLVCKEFRGIHDERIGDLFTALENYNSILQENPNAVINGLFTICASEKLYHMYKRIIEEWNRTCYKMQHEALEKTLDFVNCWYLDKYEYENENE